MCKCVHACGKYLIKPFFCINWNWTYVEFDMIYSTNKITLFSVHFNHMKFNEMDFYDCNAWMKWKCVFYKRNKCTVLATLIFMCLLLLLFISPYEWDLEDVKYTVYLCATEILISCGHDNLPTALWLWLWLLHNNFLFSAKNSRNIGIPS